MAKVQKESLITPDQEMLMALIKEGLTKGSGPLADIFGGFNEKEFEEGIANPALKDFQTKILPMLTEKFIAGNQVGGSGMQHGFQQAGTDLQNHLAQLKYGAIQDAKNRKAQGLQTALNVRPFENIVEPPKEKAPKSSIWSSIIPAAATVGGAFLGGPGGAMLANAVVGGATKAIAG